MIGKMILVADVFSIKTYAQDNNVHRLPKTYLVMYLNAAMKNKIQTFENSSVETFHP